jgi:hypothetical protein
VIHFVVNRHIEPLKEIFYDSQQLVCVWMLNVALIYIHDIVAIDGIQANFTFANGKLKFISIKKWLCHSDAFSNDHIRKFSDTLNGILNFVGLEFDLGGVVHLLDLATAAPNCQGTRRLHTVRRWQ